MNNQRSNGGENITTITRHGVKKRRLMNGNGWRKVRNITKFWANIIPYTPYAKLQTEQWVIGSPISSSLLPLLILTLYVVFYAVTSVLLLKKRIKGAVS